MDIDFIVSELSGKSLSNDLVGSLRLGCASAKIRRKKIRCEVKCKVAELLALMSTNDVKGAKLLARALIVFSPDDSILEMRRVGVFRSSKYKFKTSVAKAVVRDCIANISALGLDSEQCRYLSSVEFLLGLGSRVRQINLGILEVVKNRRKFVIKTLLANLEMMFAARSADFNKGYPSDVIEHYSNEDLAEAFSHILKLHRDELGVNNDHFQHVDESAASTSLYWRLLIDAAKVCKYKEAELLLDAFPYQAYKNSTELVVEAIDPRLEQSVRLGYIQTTQQMIARRIGLDEHVFNESNPHRPDSIARFSERFYEALKEQAIFINTKPIPRYVLGCIMIPELFKPFSTDDLFEEEIEALVQLGLENYEYDTLKDVEIRDGISALDIMKVQRLFRFVSVIYQRALAGHQGGDQYSIALRSVLPIFNESQLVWFLELILPGRDYKKVLELISLDISRADHIDIQYTPLVKISESYLVAPAIVANSNLARNIFCGQRIKQPFVGEVDPMQSKIAEALEFQGFSVAQEINITFKKKKWKQI